MTDQVQQDALLFRAFIDRQPASVNIGELDPFALFQAGLRAKDSGAAVRGEPVAESATDQLYSAVMNIPVTRTMSHFARQAEMRMYKEGHRDARHAAADLIAAFSSSARAAEAPSELSALAKLLRDAVAQNVTPFPAQILAAADALDSQPAEHKDVEWLRECAEMAKGHPELATTLRNKCRPTVAAQQRSIADDAQFLDMLEAWHIGDAEGSIKPFDELVAYIDSRASSAPVAPIAPDDWQPIATAPADCILLLATEFFHKGDWRIKVGGYWNGGWEVFGASWMPSHWMPIPLPPAPQQEGSEAGNG